MRVLNFCVIFFYFISPSKGMTFFKTSQLDAIPLKTSFSIRSQSFLSEEEQTIPQQVSPVTDSLPLNDSPIKPTLETIPQVIDPLPSVDLTSEKNVNATSHSTTESNDDPLVTTQNVSLVNNNEKKNTVNNQEKIVASPDLTNKTLSVTDHETKEFVLPTTLSHLEKPSNVFDNTNQIIDRTTMDTTPAIPDVLNEDVMLPSSTKPTSNMSPLIIDKKHTITDEIRSQFVPFQPYDASFELCFDVFTDLRQHALFSSNAYLLFNILVSIDVASQGQPGQAIQEDKNVYVSMEELHHKSFLTLLRNAPCQHDEKKPFNPSLCFHDRISKCVTDHKHGRTLYQTIISLGFEKSYQSLFVKTSLSEKTDSGYEPLFALDKEGNTLLHLAAASGSTTILKDLLDRVASPSTLWSDEPNVAEKGYYYILNAMNHFNHNHQLPLDVAKTSGVRLRLKRTYRTVIQFVRTLRAENV